MPFFLTGKRTINNEPSWAQGEIRLASCSAYSGTMSVMGPLAQPRGFLRNTQRAHEVPPAPPWHLPAQEAQGQLSPLENTKGILWPHPRLGRSQLERGRELIEEFTKRGQRQFWEQPFCPA